MTEKKTLSNIIFDTTICIIITLLSIVCLYPMLYVLFASFSDPIKFTQHSGFLFSPVGFSLAGYEMLLKNPNLISGYTNTFFYVIVGTFLNLIMTLLGAYALAAKGYKFKKIITLGIIFTMYLNAGMIPNFLLIKNLNLLDNRLALLMPSLIQTWNLIIMRTSFAAIPASLEESARMDGANDFQILFKIFIPLAKATIAVMLLFYSVSHWNSWFDAMVYLPHARDKWPLQLFLRETLVSGVTSSTTALDSSSDNPLEYVVEIMKYSMIIVSTVPILCVYPFIQKYFNKGVMMGSIKG